MSLIALAFAAALAGQDPSERPEACLEDDESTACDQAERARLLVRYGVASIESEAATGAEVFRSFFYNGYGSDRLVVSFEARPEQAPVVVVSGLDSRRVQIPVTAQTWDRVVGEAVNADRLLSPVMPPPAVDGELDEVICIHGWSVIVELANATDGRGDRPGVRRRQESSCDDDGLAVRFAFLLADLAVRSLPACDQLDPDKHRNDVSRLDACLYLAGNSVAAASLMNEKGEPPASDYGAAATEDDWRRWLSTDSTSRVDWAGEIFQESNRFSAGQPRTPRLADVMLQRAATLRDLRIYQSEVGARNANDGWIKGEISYRVSADGEPESLMVADYLQSWSRGGGFGWRMDDWVVGQFRPFQMPK